VNADYIPVWKQVTPELAAELIEFWRENKAIGNEAAAAARAMQAVCIARDEQGALCGVCTAVIKVLPRLRQPMYYFRQYFAKRMRGRNHIQSFHLRAKGILEDFNTALDKPESLGILLELENTKLANVYNRAYEPAFDSTFIGYSPQGLVLRVSYFKDAVLQAPAPLRAPAAVGMRTRANAARPAPSIPRHGNVRS
jgi:hypothetical protein